MRKSARENKYPTVPSGENEMTSRERFQAVCEHRDPDRFPIDFMPAAAVSETLKGFYQVHSERELLDVLGADFYYLSCRDISQNETSLPIYRGPKLDYTDTERTCPFGIRFRRSVYGHKFGADEAIRGPLEGATSVREILDHPWPKVEWFDVAPFLTECEMYSDKVIVGGFWTGIFGHAYRMHGLEQFMMDMAMRPEVIKTLVDRLTDFYLELNDRVFSTLKGKMDVYFLGNDFGSQNGLLFSKAMWIDFFYEDYEKVIAHARGYGLKVMVHSCGAISELLEPLIELGTDIIDPVQTTAVGMEPVRLKETFGDRIVFHGAIDTQKVLPSETPENVYKHAVETMQVLGRDGGYIFLSCNNIQTDTPIENVHAMYRAAREYRP